MRSRPAARRTPVPDAPRTPEGPEPIARSRPAGRATPPPVRRARRSTEPVPEPPSVEPPVEALDPGELYRREKSRRAPRVDPSVMADARRQLEEMMTPISGRKRGSTFGGAAAKRRKAAARPDDIELPEYRPGERGGRGAAADEEE